MIYHGWRQPRGRLASAGTSPLCSHRHDAAAASSRPRRGPV